MLNSSKATSAYGARMMALILLIAQALIAHASKECAERANEASNISARSESPRIDITRVSSVSWDAVLHRKWGLVADCEHPEWPQHIIPLYENGPELIRVLLSTETIKPVQQRVALTVHVGKVVSLWKIDRFARIELTGVSEESGVMGQRIRVRSTVGSGLSDESGHEIFGFVRGPSNVEMER